MQNIFVTNMHFKYLNRLHVMLGLSWKHSGAPWVMKWKKAIQRWVKTALGQSVTQTEVAVKVVCLLVSRLLLAGEVASFIGTEDAHCYTQKDRHHNHYAQDDSSNVDVIYKKRPGVRSWLCRVSLSHVKRRSNYVQTSIICGPHSEIPASFLALQ